MSSPPPILTRDATGMVFLSVCRLSIRYKRLAGKRASEMTYFVSSGTLNFNSVCEDLLPLRISKILTSLKL